MWNDAAAKCCAAADEGQGRFRIVSALPAAPRRHDSRQFASRADVTNRVESPALVGNGNLRADTVAAYLVAMGFELRVELPASYGR
jgi:DNA-binding phage protein